MIEIIPEFQLAAIEEHWAYKGLNRSVDFREACRDVSSLTQSLRKSLVLIHEVKKLIESGEGTSESDYRILDEISVLLGLSNGQNLVDHACEGQCGSGRPKEG